MNNKKVLYKGYKEIVLSECDRQYFYEHLDINIYDCKINEYLILSNEDNEHIDTLKWDGSVHYSLGKLAFKSRMLGTLKPFDEIQHCAFDSIRNNEITLLYGRAGSGKTTIPLAYIMQEIEGSKIDRLFIISDFAKLKGQRELGHVPGDLQSKILSTGSISGILNSKLGDYDYISHLGMDIHIVPTMNLRGIEFGANDIVYVSECQNLSPYVLKTIIQRCKSGCKQLYEGDMLEQQDVDMKASGMQRMIDVFSGHKLFGCVKLKNNYRSELCELADMMTEY